MYRTKNPSPKPKIALPKAPRVAPTERPLLIKLTFIPGLKSVALEEISKFAKLKIAESFEDKIYLDFVRKLKQL